MCRLLYLYGGRHISALTFLLDSAIERGTILNEALREMKEQHVLGEGGGGCSFVSLIQHSVVTSTWLSYFLVQRKPWGDVFLLISLATPTIFEFDFVVVLYVKRSYFAKYHSLKQYKSHLHLSKASEYLWNFFILLCLSFYFSSFSEIMFLFPLFS